MDVAAEFERLLVCPHDLLPLSFCDGGLLCEGCGRSYPRQEGVIHFITSERDRPRTPRLLAEDYRQHSPECLHVDYYRKVGLQQEQTYLSNPVVKKAVDFVDDHAGIVVDLATRSAGAYIVPTLRRLPNGAVLFATDACLPVVATWYECLRVDYADRFGFLDIDLEKRLCFSHESIDVFCARGIANLNNGNPECLLREVRRCLKPPG